VKKSLKVLKYLPGLRGSMSSSPFDWSSHQSFLTHWSTPWLTAFTYVSLVLLANATLPNDQAPLSFRKRLQNWTRSSSIFYFVSVLHNSILILVSIYIFVGFLYGAHAYIQVHGYWHALCPPPSAQYLTKGPPFLIIYIFYVSKYYELLDTVLLACKGRRIIPLHAYHHMIMLPSMWLCFDGDLVSSLFGLAFFNSAVHIIMYTYYLFYAIGYKFSLHWKKWVTRLQILQFVTGACGGTFFFLLYVTQPSFSMTTGFNYIQGCAGKSYSILAVFIVNISFLIFFIKFFQKTYRRSNENTEKKLH